MPPLIYKTGVYKITNKVNGKLYIGSTAEFFKKRWACHINDLRSGRHKNLHLQRSWDRDGEHNFEFLIVEYCPPEKCIEREQHYIDLYEPWDDRKGYNKRKVAESNLGIKYNEEIRQKNAMGRKDKRNSPEHNRKISEALRGKKKSPEHVEKVAAKKRGKKLTDDHKRKISETVAVSCRTLEYREQMSKIKKGRIVSDETRRKLSEVRKGIVFSAEWRKNMSESRKGKPGTWIGKKHTAESKKKISNARKKREEERRNTGSTTGLVRTTTLFQELT